MSYLKTREVGNPKEKKKKDKKSVKKCFFKYFRTPFLIITRGMICPNLNALGKMVWLESKRHINKQAQLRAVVDRLDRLNSTSE